MSTKENDPIPLKRIVAIDFDTPVYAIGFKTEGEPVSHALHSAKVFIERICSETEADEYILFLTGKGNFREKLATIQPYKGNRVNNRKPEHYNALREYAIEHHGAIVIDGAEADDALGIFLTSNDHYVDKVIATIDKDLNGVPGMHYNWDKKQGIYVTDPDADLFFLQQILTGDATDNIPGLYRVTGKKASQKLKDRVTAAYYRAGSFLDSFQDGYCEVLNIFQENVEPEEAPTIWEEVEEIANLLWIQRDGYETFKAYYNGERKES